MTALDAIGRDLLEAERERRPVPAPTERVPQLSIEQAYAIQRAVMHERMAAGAQLVGHKVGLTSVAMQEMLGVDQPDFGYLTSSMVSESGCALEAARFIAPRAELEIAFRLARPLHGRGLTIDDVLAATEAVAPALELIDSRVADWRITIADTIADNASSGHVVLGAWRSPEGLDLSALRGELVVHTPGQEPASAVGVGDAVLGHPAAAVAWLAVALDQYAGEHLEAGQVILPGAMARALPVAVGCSVRGTVTDLGDVEASFV